MASAVAPPVRLGNPPVVFGRALIRRLAMRASLLTGIPQAEITGPGRSRDTAWTRFAIAAVAKENGKSLWQIATVFGQDHTSVLHGIGRAAILAEQDAEFAELLRLLRAEAAQ